MSAKSMRIIAGMAAGVVLVAGYAVYAFGKCAEMESLQSWAAALLVFIGISVAAEIAVQIVFHIALSIGVAVKEGARCGAKNDEKAYEKKVERIISSTVAEDERDQLIGLKSSRAGYICAGAGVLAALIALAAGAADALALHIAFGAFAIGAMAEGAAQVFYYERGVRNG